MPRADMIGQWHPCVAVVLADKPALRSKPEFRESGIADHDLLQSQKLFEVQGVTTGFFNCTAPSLDTVLWRTLSLDCVAGFGILQQQKSSRTRKEVTRDTGNDFPCSSGQVQGLKSL